jgi:hypothetical protein
MGNMQCLDASTVYDSDFQLDVKTKSRDNRSTEQDDDFFTIHTSDPPRRCILESSVIMDAFVDQAETLIRREKFTSGPTSALDDSIISSGNSVISFPEKESLHVDTVPSMMTTMSTSTRMATNLQGKTSLQVATKKGMNRPALLGADDFSTNFLRRDILSFLTQHHIETEVGISETSCIMTPCADVQLFNPTYAATFLKHTSVLHLKMFPHCYHFYHNYMTRLLPDNPLTKAIAKGFTDIDLSPPTRHLMQTLAGSGSSAIENDSTFVGEGPPSSPVMLLATDSVFMDLALTGSLGLVDRKKFRSLKDCMAVKPNLRSPEHYMVLLNRRSGVPLLVCALKATATGPPVVRIFATKSRVFGQKVAAETHALGLDWGESLPLYTWAEIVTTGRYPDRVRYSIFMATGSDGRFEITPSYCAVHEWSGGPEIKVVGRTERETYHAGCAVLSLCKDSNALDDDDEAFLRLSISRGIDPALLICFAAFVDEALEKTMRMQCQA